MSTPQIIGTSHSIVQRDGQTYIAVDGMTPDQIITWMHDHHRKQAFAAIRRAADFIRDYEAEWPDSDGAEWLRDCVRAAIGSDKA